MTPLTQASLEAAFISDEALHKAAVQIAQNIVDGKHDIAQFVDALGFALTATTVDVRVNGTKLLSEVLLQLPKDLLNATQLELLTTFYADRTKDHHNVIPAVINGIEALVNMESLAPTEVPKLLRNFFQHTTCQSQLRNDRAKLFRILKYLTEHYAEELKAMKGDFVYALVSSIDGERDPRNLDFIFTFMPDFIAKYPLLHLTEEMFEVFACYFPIDFNPTLNDPDTITRENLAGKLTSCLVATPDFAEWTISLALEKLESDLVVAKLDSLQLLQQAALKFPPKTLEPHFEQIWSALKIELFPGSDNDDVLVAALKALRTLLEQVRSVNELSHNVQTIILGTVLPHLNDVNQRLFHPATAIALVCVSGDAVFASSKILETFLLKLQATDAGQLDVAQRIKVYDIIAQVFKIASKCNALEHISKDDVCTPLHADVISSLRRSDETAPHVLDLKRAALSVLNESAPVISEPNRALVYQALVQLITHDDLELEFTPLLEGLGALYPIELQSNCIDVCIRNFSIYSKFVKRKVLKNLLPLVPQMAFTQRVLDLVWAHVFQPATPPEVRQLALEALNSLLTQQTAAFIVDLQHNSELIEKLVELAQTQHLDMDALEQVAAALSRIVQQLDVAEQYMIVTEYLPKLNLQLEADLFVAKGLLGFLHQDISLDDHFERLMNDLIKLSLESDNERLRQVAHQLMCSVSNKMDYGNKQNRHVLSKMIAKLKAQIEKEDPKAVEALSWVAKALVVCGFEEVGEVIEALTDLLDHPSLSTAAALAFSVLSAEYPELHLPIVKYLFRQKFFHTIMMKLGIKLENYCEHHLVACIYVLKTTPHAVLKMNIEQVGPILFKTLECTNANSLCITLEICQRFVDQQDEYFRAHLNHIIPSCVKLTKFEPSMQVRIDALNLLFEITKYPTFVLLPFKTDVILDLATTLDDPKRLVRNAAVRARNSWFLIGAPNTEN